MHNNETLIIVPAPLRQEEPVWSTPEGERFLTGAMQQLCGLGLSVCVAGEDTALLSAARASDCHVVESFVGTASAHPCLPQGGDGAMDAIISAGYRAETYVVVDIRNPEVPSLVRKALNTLHEGKSQLVLSGVEPRDHPCQLFSAYEMVDAGLVRHGEAGIEQESLAGQGTVGCRMHGDELVLDPGMAVSDTTASDMGVNAAAHTAAVAAYLHGDELEQPPVYFVPNQGFPAPKPGGSVLWFYLAPSVNGRMDLHLPFLPENGAWGYTQQKVAVVDQGKEVNGRQSFPSLVACDGSLAAWQSGDLDWPEHLDGLSEQASLILGSDASVIVHNGVDLLQLEGE